MLTGKYPFSSKKSNGLMKHILKNEVVYPDSMQLKHIAILKKMLNKDPKKRLSVQNIMKYMCRI